ncbi:MAG: hypothetical protein K2K27_08995 [Muribaculaceae bacterium]|nr:hypothetical protein [Muribaculaceae bacterium]
MNLQFSPTSSQSRFINLRHAPNGLSAVGPLVSVKVDADSKLLLSIGYIDILYSPDSLIAVNHHSGEVCQFDTADTEPRCAIQLSPDTFTLFFNDHRVSYSIDNNNVITRSNSPVIPPFSVIASPLSSVSSRISAVSLSRKYSASEVRLEPTDVDRVSSALLSSVASASSSAWTYSRFVTPVIARCRVVDDSDQTVFVGPPLLVNPLTNVDLSPLATWSVSTEYNSLPPSSIEIDSFGLQLKTFAGTATPGLSVIVEIINLSLIDFDASARCVISRNSSGNSSLTATSPLLINAGEVNRIISAILSSADDLFVPFARIENPFDGSEKTILLTPDKPFVTASSPREVSRKFKHLLELSAFRDYKTVESLSLPHQFIPTVASKNGSAVLYANPEVLFFDGYAPPYFVGATSGKSGQWHATAIVEFDDDTSVGISSFESSGNIPLILSPVISYPSRHAKAITIEVNSIGGTTWRRRFDLSSLSGRDMALFINDSLQPINLSNHPASQTIIPASNPPRILMPGAIITASADEPFLPIDVIRDGDTEILAISPVVYSPRGLEQRRNRFYLFGNEGVKLATLNDKRQVVNIVLIDRRGVKFPDCVTYDSNGRAIVLTASGHLLALSGSSSTTLDHIDGRTIASDNIKDELWIFTDSSDEVIVRDMTAGDYYVRLIDGCVESVLSTPSTSSILVDNKVMRLGREVPTGLVKIEATIKIDGTAKSRRSALHLPAFFLFKLGAPHSEAGLVTATPDDLLSNSRGGAVRSKIFSGVVSREIFLPVNFYPSETYTAHLEARVTPGSVFGGVKILYKR